MSRAVIYIRVSSSDQVEGTSLETQEKTCREYCAREDMEVAKLFSDRGESAKTADRPKFQEMVRFCTNRTNRIDYVVVYRLDRLARNNHDHAVYTSLLAARDVAVRSATESISDDPTGRFVTTVLSGIAELDNDIRGQRAKDGMLRVVEKGGWPHKAPLGYVNGRDDQDQPILVEDPKQGPMIRQAFMLASSGKHSLTEIRNLMERKGWETVFGSKPILQIIEKTLRKPIHGGIITGSLTGGKPIDARFKGIVDKATFYRVQKILDGKGHVTEIRRCVNPDFPLRRFVRCGHCGKLLTASFSTGRNGRYAYYRCANPECRKINVAKDTLESKFRDLLDSFTASTMPQFGVFRTRVRDLWRERHAEAINERKRQQRRLEGLEKQRSVLLDKLVNGVISDEIYGKKDSELDAEIALCKAERHDADLEEIDVEAALKVAEYMFRHMREIWDRLGIDRRQRFQKTVFSGGLDYTSDKGFGTVTSGPFINILQADKREESLMARPRGIEPRLLG